MNAALWLLLLQSPSGSQGAGYIVTASDSVPYTVRTSVSSVYAVTGGDSVVYVAEGAVS